MSDDDLPWIDQFSPESAAALRRATADLVEAIGRYTDEVTAMRGGSSELRALFASRDRLTAAVEEFHDRASDHTGMLPFLLGSWEDDEEDLEDDEDTDDPADDTGGALHVCLLSRWDLAVHDPAALLEAGRAAHRRLRPSENGADAAAAVADAPAALYAIAHEVGEPWPDIPGVAMVAGARVYLVADDPLEVPDDSVESIDHVTEPPPGRIAFTETWR